LNDNLEEILARPRMISYAQNLEDVILQRALRNISNGFYIDVGAGDPISDSVTKHFYDTGWSGINLEPHPTCFQTLQSQRPRDSNLELIASNHEGTEDFYFFEHSGYSTSDAEIAEAHIHDGHVFRLEKIQSTTLNKIFKDMVNKREVHFLKIDVEGNERKVLEGIDFKKNRPWILVLEATFPNSQVDNFQDWEHLVVNFSYELIYRDGLNRFYLAKEHQSLKPTFEYPPNVFDNYEQFYGHRQNELDRLRRENTELRDQLNRNHEKTSK